MVKRLVEDMVEAASLMAFLSLVAVLAHGMPG